jgi:hypothetical protein
VLGTATVGRKEEALSAITPTIHDTPFRDLSVGCIIERLEQTVTKIHFTQVKSAHVV